MRIFYMIRRSETSKRIIILFFLLILFYSSLLFSETIIYDNKATNFSLVGTWSTGTSAGYQVTDYNYILTVTGSETASATWTAEFSSAGAFEVFTWYVQGLNRPTDARYIINHSGGQTVVNVNQTTNGSQWFSLGTYNFPVTGGWVKISNSSSVAGKAVIADAVKFVKTGTTYGNAYQGMWIFSWGLGFLSPTQTADMINVARTNYLNIIFPEVRKIGDAYYISATEPFASNIASGYTDPLADIISKAHDISGGKQYIEVHAWIVPYRVWADSQGTPPSNHVLSEHPEWRGQTDTGDTSDGNQYLDPGVPAVTDYLVEVVTEIVQNYDVDGIHFDYFRYSGTNWGYNPTAIARFNALYGKSGQPATDDPDFCDFRRDQIRQMGRKVYVAIKKIRWDCKMSAATIQWGSCPSDFTQSSAYNSIFQDWVGFMSEGLLDMNVMMNYKREYYTDQAQDYRDWVQKLASTKAGRHAVNGPAIYMNSIHDSVTQILYGLDTSGINGSNFYVYHQTNKDGDSANDFWYTIRADCFTQRRNIPTASWIESPTQGILCGTVRNASGVLDGISVTLSNGASGTIKTDGTGFYAFLKLNAGNNYQATASYNSDEITKSFNITAGQVTDLNFDFTKYSLTVNSAYDTPVPSSGSHNYFTGSSIDAYITNPTVNGPSGTRYVCMGWSGTGFTPSTGTGTSVNFEITQNCTLTWLWKTQYFLTTASNPTVGGAITLSDGSTPASDWYDANQDITVKAIPASGYKFNNWTGDLSSTNSTEILNMNSPKSITANFSPSTNVIYWSLY